MRCGAARETPFRLDSIARTASPSPNVDSKRPRATSCTAACANFRSAHARCCLAFCVRWYVDTNCMPSSAKRRPVTADFRPAICNIASAVCDSGCGAANFMPAIANSRPEFPRLIRSDAKMTPSLQISDRLFAIAHRFLPNSGQQLARHGMQSATADTEFAKDGLQFAHASRAPGCAYRTANGSERLVRPAGRAPQQVRAPAAHSGGTAPSLHRAKTPVTPHAGTAA